MVCTSRLADIESRYPSHGFVIDREEATMLFSNVREPSGNEIALAQALGQDARRPIDWQHHDRLPFLLLFQEKSEDIDTTTEKEHHEGTGLGHLAGTGLGETVKEPGQDASEPDGNGKPAAELSATS